MFESYLKAVTPDIRNAYERHKKEVDVAFLFQGIVERHAFIGGKPSQYQLILPRIRWGDEPDTRGYFNLLDHRGEVLLGDKTRQGAAELIKKVTLAELLVYEGYEEPVLTIDTANGTVVDYNNQHLTIDQLNGTAADLQRYEQTILDGTGPVYEFDLPG
jgi:hypothetical protein